MAKRKAPQWHKLYSGGVRNVAIDFSGLLDAGESLSGTPSVTDSSGLLSISGEQVSSVALVINRVTVAAGLAVSFTVDRNSAPRGRYDIDVSVSTDAGQTIPGTIVIECV